MPKSVHAQAVDEIQRALRPWLREQGFTVKGRTFNRATEDALTQVVSIQMGASIRPARLTSRGYARTFMACSR